MSDDHGTLARIAAQLAGAMRPLEEGFRDPEAFRMLMFRLGWEVHGLPPSYPTVADKAIQVGEALRALANDASIDRALAVINKAGDVYRAIRALDKAPDGIDPTTFLPEFGRRLTELLLGQQLLAEAPKWFATFQALGIIVLEDTPETSQRPGFTRLRFDWDQIPTILTDPTLIPKGIYGWGSHDIKFSKLAETIGQLASALGLPTSLDLLSAEFAAALQADGTTALVRPARQALTAVLFDLPIDDTYVEIGILLAEMPAKGSELPGIILLPFVPNKIAQRVDIGGGWAFTLGAGTDLTQQLAIVIRPGEILARYPFAPGQKLPSGGFGISMVYDADQPLLLFGEPEHTRLELKSFETSFNLEFRGEQLEVRLEAAPQDMKLVIAAADFDGFLEELMGDKDVTITLPLTVRWSSKTGIGFVGGTCFQVSFPGNLSFGPVTLQQIQLALTAGQASDHAPDLSIEAGASLSGQLGPLALSVDNIGLRLITRFTDGNAGPFDIAMGFKPPNGIGLTVHASSVEGGGFLLYDPDNEQYAGAVQLQLLNFTLKAIGLLTPAPKGSTVPFSLIMVFSIEDFEPIVFGPGIKWTAFGGLIGLNRTANVEAFRLGLKNHALDSVLFPENPVAEAPRLLASLRTLFPPAADRFLVGVAAKFEWPAPTLLTAELGFIVELPTPFRLIVVGQFRARLPRPDLAQVKINIDAVGIYDFQRNELSIDATLFESSISSYALIGDGILRMGGDETLLSLGGFHPHYKPPPGLPQLQRLSVNFSEGGTLRLRAESYVAVTSNSFQFGAKIDAFIGFGGFSVEGNLGFDILFQSEYPEFVALVHCGIAVKYDGYTLAGAQLDMTVSGYKPLHLQGKATFEFLGFDKSKSFNKTFFNDEPPPTLPLVDPLLDIVSALRDGRNWSTKLPKEVSTLVTVRNRVDSDVVMIHPLGEIAVRQRVAPLNLELTRFGQSRPAGDKRFAITDFTLGNQPVDPVPLRDKFATGQFLDLTDTERLSRPSLESLDAGVKVSSVEIRFGGQNPEEAGFTAVDDLAYETCIVGEDGGCLPVKELHQPDWGTVVNDAQVGPAARAALRLSGARKYQSLNPGIRVQASAYAIANVDDLKPADGGPDQKTVDYSSYTAAEQALQWQKSQKLGRPDGLQIVWKFELAKENS